MRVRTSIHLSAVIVCVFQSSLLTAADFEKDVKPILVRRCVACHGPDDANGDVRFDTLSTDLLKNSAAAETWHDVLNVLNLGEMPPEDEKQPTGNQRSQMLAAFDAVIDDHLKQHRSWAPVVMPRLNRCEYNNNAVARKKSKGGRRLCLWNIILGPGHRRLDNGFRPARTITP